MIFHVIVIPPANFVCGGYTVFIIPPQTFPANLVCDGYTVFTSVRGCVRPSVTFCFFNNLKSHCWILTTEGERLFHCGIVRGKKSSSGHHCMSGIYNIGHCVMTW